MLVGSVSGRLTPFCNVYKGGREGSVGKFDVRLPFGRSLAKYDGVQREVGRPTCVVLC